MNTPDVAYLGLTMAALERAREGLTLDRDRHHYYRNGQYLPGVSQVLTGIGVSSEPPAWIPTVENALARGNDHHEAIASGEIEYRNTPLADSWRAWRERDRLGYDVLAAEAPLATNPLHQRGYAGTADLVLDCPDHQGPRILIVDVKTGKGAPRWAKWQAAAYAFALGSHLMFPGAPRIQAAVLELFVDGSPGKLTMVDQEAMADWAVLLAAYRIKRGTKWHQAPRPKRTDES